MSRISLPTCQPQRPAPGRSSPESGFALLFVFAMAAAVAFALYLELPRVSMEALRDREQLLVSRGEQYKRAVQLYVRKFNKYPATLDELEKSNNIRFLRRRYKDPMTGKAEWRLVHVGPGGVFLDSLVHKPPSPDKDKDKEKTEQAAGMPGFETPPYAAVPGQPMQPVLRRRPSELGSYPTPGPAGDPGQFTTAGEPQLTPYPAPGQPVTAYPQPYPGQQPVPGYPQPGQQTGPYPFLPPGQQQPGAYPQIQPGQVSFPQLQPGQQQPPYPTQGVPGLPGPYGRPGSPTFLAPVMAPPVSSQTGGVMPTPYNPYSTQPGVSGAPTAGQSPFPQPGYQPVPSGGSGQNPALEMIQKILTTPRAGGLSGGQAGTPGAFGGQIMGGGIAGVASTKEAEGVMVYNEKTKYNEWEFLYDIRKDPTKVGQFAMGGMAGTGQPGQVGQTGQPGATQGTQQTQPSLFTPIQPSGGRGR